MEIKATFKASPESRVHKGRKVNEGPRGNHLKAPLDPPAILAKQERRVVQERVEKQVAKFLYLSLN